ncbi:MAG: metallophosphoesterase [Chlamydiia bacterium]|nr:metallophosphoesterase [Chlamydiia bacterium]
MKIWAMGDLHLSVGVPEKKMDVFGPEWVGYMDNIAANWRSAVAPEDLVLIPGDISWAMKLSEVEKDFAWIEALPGKKVMIRGNHDYWWSSVSKVKKILPPSCSIIQNDAVTIENITIGGARLWDTPEYHFTQIIDVKDGQMKSEEKTEDEKIFLRELGRLERSLKAMDQGAHLKIVMTHYPPIGLDLKPSRVSKMLETYGVNLCVFGHLHSVKQEGIRLFGKRGKIGYYLTSADYLNFSPFLLSDEEILGKSSLN